MKSSPALRVPARRDPNCISFNTSKLAPLWLLFKNLPSVSLTHFVPLVLYKYILADLSCSGRHNFKVRYVSISILKLFIIVYTARRTTNLRTRDSKTSIGMFTYIEQPWPAVGLILSDDGSNEVYLDYTRFEFFFELDVKSFEGTRLLKILSAF